MNRVRLLPSLLFAGVPLAFLIGVAVFQLSVAVPEARRARVETVASFGSIAAAAAVDHAAQDAERGQRGFLVTGREAYLAPYIRARAALPDLMANLQEATRDSPDQRPRVLRLQADLTTKMNELDSTLTAFRSGGFAAAQPIVNTDLGRASMEAITADIDAIAGAEKSRLSARLAQARRAEALVTTMFVVGGLISCVALVLGAVLLARAYANAASSERTLQATLDSVREGVAAFDPAGRLRVWNTPFVRLLGLDTVDLKRDKPIPAASPGLSESDVVRRMLELDATARRTGRPVLVTHPAPHGATLELFHNPVADGAVTTVLDVSDQRQAEEALRQTQKLEALGQMTGGVAHDFNNLLTIIIGSLAFLRRSVTADGNAEPNGKIGERIDMIQVAAERGAKLTKQLLAFARRQPLRPEVVNLGQLMQEILPLLRRAVGDGVEIECVTAGGLWNTTVDAAQFQSAALNLAINSRDAMAGGGKLTIEVGNAALDDLYSARHAEVEPGQYVAFAMTDTGRGMDAATMQRALDPFFTTKPPGEGTGLGLPQVYGFVKQSGGHMKLYSEVGEGTTVKLYLPRSLRAAHQPAARPTSLAVTGTETVLLVDDDEIVRATVASMLEELGYAVLTAGSGAEALAMLEQGRAVDLLFTDVVMPGIGGRHLAERAAAVLPTLKVLFTSGYTENAIVHNGRLDPGVELLSKPYDRDLLAAKVRRVLDATAAQVGNLRQSSGSTGQL